MLQFPLPAKVGSCFLHLPISHADYGFEDIQRHLSLEDLQDDSTSGNASNAKLASLATWEHAWKACRWGVEVEKRVQDQWWLQLGYR
jgi:hypothetical protein